MDSAGASATAPAALLGSRLSMRITRLIERTGEGPWSLPNPLRSRLNDGQRGDQVVPQAVEILRPTADVVGRRRAPALQIAFRWPRWRRW